MALLCELPLRCTVVRAPLLLSCTAQTVLPFHVSVLGVDELQLRTRAAGSNTASHAVWLDPCLLVREMCPLGARGLGLGQAGGGGV
jgi:hypothetical protein